MYSCAQPWLRRLGKFVVAFVKIFVDTFCHLALDIFVNIGWGNILLFDGHHYLNQRWLIDNWTLMDPVAIINEDINLVRFAMCRLFSIITVCCIHFGYGPLIYWLRLTEISTGLPYAWGSVIMKLQG